MSPDTTSRQIKTDKPELESDTSSSKDACDAECIYCSELWSAGNDDMTQCSICSGWAHECCAGNEGDPDKTFVCALCS